MEEQSKKPMSLKKKLVIFEICSFIASVAPLLITLIVRWDKYTQTTAGTFKLCLGGFILLIFAIMKAIGKLKMPRRVITFAIVLILAYLLKAIMDDIIILSAMALLGEILDEILFARQCKKLREQIKMEAQGDITTEKVKQALREMGVGNG